MNWTPEAIARLTELWVAGLPTLSIGRELGCTKNMVIGKANRLGLQPRRAAPKKPMPPPIALKGPACCWPIGNPGTPQFRFCGEAAALGKSYCDAHNRIAYVAKQPSRDPLARRDDVRRAERIR